MSLFRSALLFAFLLIPFKSANAVSFDFSAYATSTGEHGAVSEAIVLGGGYSVTVSSSDLMTNTTYLAYFDVPLTSGEPGGLGVCKGLFFPGGECSEPPDDDDIGLNEVLKLVFNQPVTLTDLLFRDGDHDVNFLGNFGVLIDGVPVNAASFTQYLAGTNFAGPLTGTTFYFISSATTAGDLTNDPRYRMYLSGLTVNAVPEPMTMSLLGAGLVGGMLRRRRSRA